MNLIRSERDWGHEPEQEVLLIAEVAFQRLLLMRRHLKNRSVLASRGDILNDIASVGKRSVKHHAYL